MPTSKWETQAAAVAAPFASADATGKRGVHRIASSTNNTSTALPTTSGSDGVTTVTWAGHYVTIQSIGCDTQVAFSRGAQTLVINQAAALGTGSAAAGFSVPSGQSRDFIVPKDATYINFISSASGGYVELYMSELLAP